MSSISAPPLWAEFAAIYGRTRPTCQEHKGTKANLKKVPEDAKEAIGHGLRAKQ
jgi:hypothetical protein